MPPRLQRQNGLYVSVLWKIWYTASGRNLTLVSCSLKLLCPHEKFTYVQPERQTDRNFLLLVLSSKTYKTWTFVKRREFFFFTHAITILSLFTYSVCDKKVKMNLPRELSDIVWSSTHTAPALLPKIVILSLSPPNFSIFSCTHFRAKTWSFNPAFPVAFGWFKFRKPGNIYFYYLLQYLGHSWHIKQKNLPKGPSR